MSSQIRILLIEDDEDDYILTQDLLHQIKSFEIQLRWINRYDQAVDELCGTSFDVALVDYRLGPEDGISLIRHAMENHSTAPMILLTGENSYEADLAAMTAGASDYLIKGQINSDLLERSIRYGLERTRAEHERKLLTFEQAARQEAERAAEKIRMSEERYRLLIENLTDYAIFNMAPDGTVLDWNEGAERIFGYSEPEIVGQSFSCFFTDKEVAEGSHLRELRTAEQAGRADDERWHLRKDGSSFWASGVTTVICTEAGEVQGYAKIARDMTERKEIEDRMQYQAFHDILTGLPNRLLLADRLKVALTHAEHKGEGVAVMFLDLDHFKDINDTLGHHVGDQLLQEVGRRLHGCVRSEDTVARFGGDEFLIMLTEVTSGEDAVRVARKISKALQPTVFIGSQEISLATSIGIAVYPQDGDTPEILMKNADNALYRAKEAGRNTYRTYTQAMHVQASKRLLIENELRKALERNEFTLHYQPILDLASGKPIQAEALIRWNHPVRGLVGPDEFIQIAEESSLILPIGEWVITNVCEQLNHWRKTGISYPSISCNLSARQFSHPEFQQKLCSIVEKNGVGPELLQLEITESMAMENITTSISKLKMLQSKGFQIVIDDFGIGHSSLNYLKRLPINRLKIDKSFVRNCLTDSRDAAIVQAVTALGHTLGLGVCIEGIETPEQLEYVRNLGCDTAQGYLISKPLVVPEFEAWLVGQKYY